MQSEEWGSGTVVRGKYQIIQKIGQGAMGTVYQALHMHFQEMRALKVIAATLSSDKTFVKRFEQEAILARRLQHPNAVRVDDIDETEDGHPFIVMEFIEGENLRKVISALGPMPATRVSSIIKQVASALDAAHGLGIIHRDIKPENIVLIQSEKRDVAKVLDFGIAKFKELQSGTTGASVTDTGMVVGTPPYMSPEQAMAAPGNELDGRADIYSLGSVMYQMLTDELPIKGDTPLQIVLAHIQTPPIPIQAARAGVEIPDSLANLVMKCLEKNRQDRPPNGRAIIDELEKWESEERKKEEEKKRWGAAGRALRPAAGSGLQVPAILSDPTRAAELGAATAGRQRSRLFRLSSIAWAVVLAVAAMGITGGWWYQRSTAQGEKRSRDSAPASNLPRAVVEKHSAIAEPDVVVGTRKEKPDAPANNSENLSLERPGANPATSFDKPLLPPEPAKTRNYSEAEQAGFKAVQAEKDEARQIERLDEFVSKFPDSELLSDAYRLYYRDYRTLKNFSKVIEYADKLTALGNKVDARVRFEALYTRASAYNMLRPNDPQQAKQAKEAVALGLRTLKEIKKGENTTEAAFTSQMRPVIVYLDETAGAADMKLQDYASALEDYRAALALNPEEGAATYRVGLAYLGMSPPRQLDGFWALARATTAKSMSEPQSQEIKEYLRKLIQSYQQTACSSVVDSQLSELIQVAGNSSERPASYKMPSKNDLEAARKNMTVATVITDLKAGGEKAETTWLAACGLEFPDVPSKVISVVQGDPVVLNVAIVTSNLEFQEARRPNMEVNVAGQSEAGSITAGSPIHFTGTLTSYERRPLMLHWQKARINPRDIAGGSK
jgi:tRNA A-37 threonylcarbamoyl transferase component Bud32/tetratricopeptide (TPR) repeat protein